MANTDTANWKSLRISINLNALLFKLLDVYNSYQGPWRS